ADSRVVMQSVLGTEPFPEPLVQEVLVKAAGNPFFLEELSRAVVEGGAHDPALTVPETVQAVLAARIDRLQATDKALLQLASVMGREWGLSLLSAIAELPASVLDGCLQRLQEAEFIYARQGVSEQTYIFKHALTRDVAYQSLLQRTRQRHHQRIAHVLAERFPETVEMQPQRLAYHYAEAGLIIEAIAYWHRAGDHATQHSANQEAIDHFSEALKLLTTLADTPERARHELTLQVALAERQEVVKSMSAPEVQRSYSRARDLCQQIGDDRLIYQVLMGLWGGALHRADLQQTRELAEDFLNRVRHQHDPVLNVRAHSQLGLTLLCTGELVTAYEHLARGVAVYDLRFHPQQQYTDHVFHDVGVRCRAIATQALWLLGYPDQALRVMQETLGLAQAMAHPFSQVFVCNWAARLHLMRLERQPARECSETAMALSSEQGFGWMLAMAIVYRGRALVDLGKSEEGIRQIRQGLADAKKIGVELYRSWDVALLAEAYDQMGETEKAFPVLDEALAQVDKTEERWWEAEIYRLKGEFLQRAEGGVRKAALTPEACFQQALNIARCQQAKSLELRAPPPAWLACGRHRTCVRKLRTYLPRCMAGSPRGSTRRTYKKRRRYWRRCHEFRKQVPHGYKGRQVIAVRIPPGVRCRHRASFAVHPPHWQTVMPPVPADHKSTGLVCAGWCQTDLRSHRCLSVP
ncbi:MAG: hypothetical protein O7G88_22795, partial [bacterium]|nr:hypothetical protein [bacterium]